MWGVAPARPSFGSAILEVSRVVAFIQRAETARNGRTDGRLLKVFARPDALRRDQQPRQCQRLGTQGAHGVLQRVRVFNTGEMCRLQASALRGSELLVHPAKSGKMRWVPVEGELRVEIKKAGLLVPFSEGSPGSFSKTDRKRSGITRFHVHQLRHTFACRWLEAGGSLPNLQEMMGHASVVTTHR